MRKYLFLLLFIFNTNSLPAQNLVFGFAYPALTYSSQYGEISDSDGEFFYGAGIKADVILKFDKSNLFLKSTFNICSYQNFKSEVGFYNLSFNAFIDYIFHNKLYGGIGLGLHGYPDLPSNEINQSSVSGNLGYFLLDNYYFDMIYNFMLEDNQMQNFNVWSFSIGYKF